MPNIANVLNEQIRRLARREITTSTQTTRKQNAQYRRDIAALKRQVVSLTKVVGFLEKQEKRRVAEQPVPVTIGEDVRFRADGLKSHRAKLGLSAKAYGLLVGVAGKTIYKWESGDSWPRRQQVAKVATVRGIGKREALKRLELLGISTKGVRRGSYTQTAQEFITALVKGKKGITSAEIKAAWQKAGRKGKADNTLGLMVKAGKLKRAKLKGEKGSRYSVR